MFNLSIRPDDGQFIVNPEKHRVVWILDNTRFDFLDFARENLHICVDCDIEYNTVNRRKVLSELAEQLEMPRRFVGVAKCNEEEGDTWNEELGKTIAFTKAKDAYCKSFIKRANLYLNTIDNWTNTAFEKLSTIAEKMENNSVKRHERIKEGLGDYLRTAPQKDE